MQSVVLTSLTGKRGCQSSFVKAHRHGHVGSHQDVKTHVELSASHQVRVGEVSLYDIGLGAVLPRLLPAAVRLPFADLAQLSNDEYSSW